MAEGAAVIPSCGVVSRRHQRWTFGLHLSLRPCCPTPYHHICSACWSLPPSNCCPSMQQLKGCATTDWRSSATSGSRLLTKLLKVTHFCEIVELCGVEDEEEGRKKRSLRSLGLVTHNAALHLLWSDSPQSWTQVDAAQQEGDSIFNSKLGLI